MIKEARIYNEEKTVSSAIWCWKSLTATWGPMKLEHSRTKIHSKWLKDLNLRRDSIKLLGENIGKIFSDINLSNLFSDTSPQARKTKAKINKWDLIKLKTFAQEKKLSTK